MYEVQKERDGSAAMENGSEVRPLVTLKDGSGGVSHIIMDDGCYVLINNCGEGGSFRTASHWYPAAAHALAQWVGTEQPAQDEAGHPSAKPPSDGGWPEVEQPKNAVSERYCSWSIGIGYNYRTNLWNWSIELPKQPGGLGPTMRFGDAVTRAAAIAHMASIMTATIPMPIEKVNAPVALS